MVREMVTDHYHIYCHLKKNNCTPLLTIWRCVCTVNAAVPCDTKCTGVTNKICNTYNLIFFFFPPTYERLQYKLLINKTIYTQLASLMFTQLGGFGVITKQRQSAWCAPPFSVNQLSASVRFMTTFT